MTAAHADSLPTPVARRLDVRIQLRCHVPGEARADFSLDLHAECSIQDLVDRVLNDFGRLSLAEAWRQGSFDCTPDDLRQVAGLLAELADRRAAAGGGP